jgi:tetratricopeptide (TPR) repeat protein
MKKMYPAMLLVFMLILVCMSASHAQTPQQTLTQYFSDLQKNPNDYALRERIIRHVQTMRPAPAIPEEAERYMARGAAAVKGAKDTNDFKDAVRELEKATLAAPWLANAYYNLGFAQDKAGLYADAIKNLRLYLLAAPNAADAKKVKELIYEIEYRQEKAAKTEIRAKAEEKKKGLKDLVGNWYRKEPYDHAREKYANYAHYRGEMRGGELFLIYVIDVPYWDWRKGEERVFFIANRLQGNTLVGRFPGGHEPGTYEITVSQDFNDWEFYYKDQDVTGRQTYTRR